MLQKKGNIDIKKFGNKVIKKKTWKKSKSLKIIKEQKSLETTIKSK